MVFSVTPRGAGGLAGSSLRGALLPLAARIRPKGVPKEREADRDLVATPLRFSELIGRAAFRISFLVACFDSLNPGLCDI